MKKIFLIFVIISSSVLHSQIIKGYGVKIGGTLSHQNWDYSNMSFPINFVPDNKLGLNLGIFIESSDISFFNLSAEINFIQKGIQKELEITTPEQPDGTGKTQLWELGLNYLNLSILAKPNLNLGLLKPYLLIGPKIDIEISKSIKSIDSFIKSSESFYDEFNKSRIGIKLGIGSEIKIINFRFITEFIYDTDLSNLYKNENLEVTSNSFDFRIGVYL